MTGLKFFFTLLSLGKTLTQELHQVQQELLDTYSQYIAYNVFDYAWESWEQLITLYANQNAKILLLGINPGPHGMVQTGIPFGNIDTVKHWLKITADVSSVSFPTHPKRPIVGLSYNKEEPSGKLLWKGIQTLYPNPESFFSECFILNFCPVAFFSNDEQAKNITPDKLPHHLRKKIEACCIRHLSSVLNLFNIKHILAIGKYSEKVARNALSSCDDTLQVEVHYLTHPSPLNPKHKEFPSQFTHCIKNIQTTIL